MIKQYSIFLSVVVGLGFFLSGCSFVDKAYHKQHAVTNRDNDYLSSQTAPMLVMPPGMGNAVLGEDYPLPANYPMPLVPVSEVPPGSLAAKPQK